MTDWSSLGDHHLGTWGALVKHAAAHGVTVEVMPEAGYVGQRLPAFQYLLKVQDGEALTYPIPLDCAPSRKLGYGRYTHICSRLKIPEQPGWPIDF